MALSVDRKERTTKMIPVDLVEIRPILFEVSICVNPLGLLFYTGDLIFYQCTEIKPCCWCHAKQNQWLNNDRLYVGVKRFFSANLAQHCLIWKWKYDQVLADRLLNKYKKMLTFKPRRCWLYPEWKSIINSSSMYM